MRSNTDLIGQEPGRTFTETARRAQIIAAAIDTIAELGYGQASLARIAQTAGTSKGVIMYHFDGKDELVREVVAELVARGEAYMRPRIGAESGGAGVLTAYIESNLAFLQENRNHVIATVEIVLNARGADGRRLFDTGPGAGVAALRGLLARFQATGEFRSDFDPFVLAMAIRAAIDNVAHQFAGNPGLDVGHHARELADLFIRTARAPRRTSRRHRPVTAGRQPEQK
jgi:TetR/AcrR family transcriptional regulator, fatty acid metabolism regulator protein